jgi:hypothetical protein
VVLDDVPDVTDKHLANASSLGAEVRLDFDDLGDDVPTPAPAPGSKAPEPRSRAMAASMLARPVARARNPTPSLTPRGPTVAAAPAPREQAAPPPPPRPEDIFSKTSVGMGVGVGLRAAVGSRAPDTQPSLAPPPPAARSNPSPPRGHATPTPPGGVDAVPTTVRAPQGTLPPRPAAKSRSAAIARPVGSSPLPRAETATVVESELPFALLDGHTNHDAPITEPVPFHVDDIALASDTIPTMPAVRNSEPVVRFREPSTPPPIRAMTSPIKTATESLPVPAAPSVIAMPPPPAAMPPLAAMPSPAATPSPLAAMPPVTAASRGTSPVMLAASSHEPRLATPATELFAEPDPELDTVSDGPPASVTSAFEEESPDSARPAASPRRGGIWRVVLLLVLLAIAAAAAAVATGYLPWPVGAPVETRPAPPPPPPAAVGVVQLAVTPPDATITIDDRPAKAGAIELPPGSYQLAIQRDGHKTWLTSVEVEAGKTQDVPITLEPLSSAVPVEATLSLSTTPPGLEVVLDGTLLTDRTPIRVPLSIGLHTVVLRKDGVNVWRKAVDARSSAVYEYKPTIADPAEPSTASHASAAPHASAGSPSTAASPSTTPPAGTESVAPPTPPAPSPAASAATPTTPPAAPEADPATP